MKKILQIVMLCVLTPLLAAAQQWNEAQYRQIEQSIRTPKFADKAYVITKYGAKTDNTAAKNQKAIQKAIDLCSKKGGGRVVVPAGQKFMTGAIELKSGVNLAVPHCRDIVGGTGVFQPLAMRICFQGKGYSHHR